MEKMLFLVMATETVSELCSRWSFVWKRGTGVLRTLEGIKDTRGEDKI